MTHKPTTIAQYLDAAPAAGQPLLRRLYTLLREAAPEAQEAIKWGNPFFVEPRFVYAFSAHKAHASFAPPAATLAAFAGELAPQRHTQHMLQFPYAQPLPEDLIRRMAVHSVQALRQRQDDGFW